MLVIDPILEHMRADKEQATREAYAPLRALIAQRGVALQVAHTNKRAAQNLGSVGDKVGGVKALGGLPRLVYSVHNSEDGVGHLCPGKAERRQARDTFNGLPHRGCGRTTAPGVDRRGNRMCA